VWRHHPRPPLMILSRSRGSSGRGKSGGCSGGRSGK
jgi:hypothetical protein